MIKQAILLMLLLPFLASAQTQSPPPTKQETIEWIQSKLALALKEGKIEIIKSYRDLIYTNVRLRESGSHDYYRGFWLSRVSKVEISEYYITLYGVDVAFEYTYGGEKYNMNKITLRYDNDIENNLKERFEKAFDALIDFNKVGKPAEKY